MSVLKEVSGAAATAWSPVKRPLLAVAQNDLSLYSMNLAVPGRTMDRVGGIAIGSRVLALTWSDVLKHRASCTMGVLAGAMEDGTVSLWDASKVFSGDTALLGQVSKHKGAVTSVQFNPRPDNSHLIASGGTDGEIYITSLAKLDKPMVLAPGPSIAQPGNGITTVAWNTQAAFIVASGCQQGTTTIWDLKQKQPWCQLHDPHQAPVSAIAWSPHEGLQVITASVDDANPVVRLWDLRGSKTTPLAEFYEHRAGVLSAAWSPHDAGFVLTSGRDRRTLVWDLNSNQLACEVFDTSPDGVHYGGGYERRDLQWAPHTPGVFSAATPEATHVLGMHSLGMHALYAPEWTAQQAAAYAPPTPATPPNPLELVDAADALEQRGGDGKQFCDYKAAQASPADAVEWGFLKILFADDARKQLLLHLGFDEDEIEAEASKYMDGSSVAVSDPALASDPLPVFTQASEDIVKRSLLVGNFEAAVECCLRHNQLANALLLATCGGPELWARTQEAFFKRQQRPFMKIVAAIIKNELATLVREAALDRWKETLAILSTYSKSEEFPGLCNQLGVRLFDSGDVAAATLCFICAMNIDRAVAIWTERVHAQDASRRPLAVLHAVEKVAVFAQAIAGHATDPPKAAHPLFSEYATIMLSIGQLDIASKYGKHDAAIMDRLQQGSVYTPPPLEPQYDAPVHQVPNDYQSPAADYQEPPAAHYQEPYTAEYQEPHGAEYQEPHAAEYQPHTGDYQQPHGGDYQQSHAAEYQQDARDYQQGQTTDYQQRDAANHQQPHAANLDQPPPDAYATYDQAPYAPSPAAYDQAPYAHEPATLPAQELHHQSDEHAPSPPTPEAPAVEAVPPPVDTAPPKAFLLNTARAKSPAPKAAPPAAPVSAPAQPYATSVDLSSVPEADLSVVSAVSDLIGALEMQKLPAMEAKQLGDIKKAADVLFSKLGSGELSDVVLDLVHDMAGGLAARDIKHAQQVHVVLTKDHWTQHKDWLRGLKALIQICVKRIR
ncbi:hypothetical protein ACHHYP_11810 [Achlya hypogyna]|uniref:Uncharacterized protein n=1 Tax=Achlya hypogyna TaxID=1202772 RepID=A0A1V9YIG5_ACHHY|nr:hypothetical protein ACHHYP_11810 [Achlya hypogyna]